ncbi:neurensin-1 [Salvelinus sp. IW2-2015]|uniref:neurensin-1 n=1 Tax=Salvelinus sp. IW2-2015 TaxID=2691554 RepID=UPI0038D3B4A8
MRHIGEDMEADRRTYESKETERGMESTGRGKKEQRAQVSLALGLLVVTSGLVSLSVGYSGPSRIESFRERGLVFIDTQAVSFNRGLHHCVAAGIGLTCLGTGLTVAGLLFWSFSRSRLKERLYRRESEKGGVECGRKGGTEGGAQGEMGMAVMKAPGAGDGKVPATLSKVETVQPSGRESP